MNVEFQQVLDGTRGPVDASLVVAESTLKKYGPPYAWIDLNFQIYDNGEWYSPQLGIVHPRVEPNWDTPRERRAAKLDVAAATDVAAIEAVRAPALEALAAV